MIGSKFGALEVVGEADPVAVGKKRVVLRRALMCRCQCGKVLRVTHLNLTHGQHSCGCTKASRIRDAKFLHGRNSTDPTYSTWAAMRQRCRNPRNVNFTDYGGRGIKVCKRWDDFRNFLSDMGEKPPGKSIDRIDVNGNYEPSNCRWATNKEQRANQRYKLTTAIKYRGVTKTIAEWARQSVVSYSTFAKRIYAGWPVGKALTKPSLREERNPK